MGKIFKIDYSYKRSYSERRKSHDKTVGVYLSRETRSKLTLYCLNRNMSKSRAVGEIIDTFLESKCNKTELINSLAQEGYKVFKWRWKDGFYNKSNWESNFEKSRAFQEFAKEATDDLVEHGVFIDDVNKIIDTIQKKYEEDKTE